MNDLVSIIVPVYKVEKYLKKCVDSILNQTYSNFEIILVDDGSPDRCGDICDEYQKKDQRVKVIHKANGGLSDARNVGISASSGQFISFLDSDDWIHNRFIETLYNLLIINNADVSIANFIKIYSDDIPSINAPSVIYQYSNIDALNQIYGKYGVQMIVAWGKLFKRELFSDINFPVGKIHEDEFTVYKLLYKANKIIFTTEPLIYYRQRSNSITGQCFNLSNKLNVIEALEERARFFKTIGENDLGDKTYANLFWLYKLVYENISCFKKQDLYIFLNVKFKELKCELRKSNQSFKFRLFYELYYICPRLGNLLFNIYKMKNRFNLFL